MVRALVALLLVGTVSVARADARRDAKAHFAQGKAFYAAGAYDDAIKEYEIAYELVPLPPVLFNIAQCERLKGDKQAAVDYYQRYLAAQPDGDLADEAREHVANLRLRIEVEAAEATSKRALDEAAEARRRADAVEVERKRALEEQAAKQRGAGAEAERSQIVDELQRREQQKRADEELARHMRVAAARRGGQKWINYGGLTVGAGLVVFAAGWGAIIDGAIRDSHLHYTDPSRTSWTTSNDVDAAAQTTDSRVALGLWISGGVIALAGVTVCILGVHKRNEAVARAERQP